MAKSKFFRAFVEGSTISDGRKIEAGWIDQIAETFNAATYAPRINVEHITGYSPEPPFNGYGTVLAVKAQTDDIVIAGKTEKRRALYCQVDANEQLVNLAARDQKPYPSVELTDSYAGSGKIGMVGLAFTDNPASIATQKLQFSRHAPGTVFAPGDAPAAIEFEDAPADPAKTEGAIAGFFAALADKVRGVRTEPTPPVVVTPPAEAGAFDAAQFATDMGATFATAIAAAIKPVTDAQAAHQREFAALQAQLETSEQPRTPRKPASGGDDKFASTNC